MKIRNRLRHFNPELFNHLGDILLHHLLLMVQIVIINQILVMVPQYNDQKQKDECIVQMKKISDATELYMMENCNSVDIGKLIYCRYLSILPRCLSGGRYHVDVYGHNGGRRSAEYVTCSIHGQIPLQTDQETRSK